MNKRNDFIDILKGVAIILVVVGHSIQYGSGASIGEGFFSNNIFKIIYSFHMPLFVLISGYLFYYSEKKRNLSELFHNKFMTLIFPLLGFDTIIFILCILTKRLGFNWYSVWAIYCNRYWFFITIFIFSILVPLINKIFKKYANFIFILIYFVSFFLPEKWLLYMISYSYPYFIIGYLTSKYNILSRDIIKNNKGVICIISNIVFIILLLFFKDNYYIYVTQYSIFNGNGKRFMLLLDNYRFLIGLVGSVMAILNTYFVVRYLKRFNVSFDIIKDLGRKSLGIYGISSILFEFVVVNVTSFLNGTNYLYISIESLVMLVVCLLIIKLLSLNKITNKIFLGGK